MQLEPARADLHVARHGERLGRSQRQRSLALQVELFVERAQLALRRSGLGRRRRPLLSAIPSGAPGKASGPST